MNAKLKKILLTVNEAERQNTAHFSRSGRNMTVWFRDWMHARDLQDKLGIYGREIQIDRLSGNLFMHLENVYQDQAS